VGYFKPFSRRPKRGDFLEFGFEDDPAEFLRRFHAGNVTGMVGQWLSM
jgi:hypothetical protein